MCERQDQGSYLALYYQRKMNNTCRFPPTSYAKQDKKFLLHLLAKSKDSTSKEFHRHAPLHRLIGGSTSKPQAWGTPTARLSGFLAASTCSSDILVFVALRFGEFYLWYRLRLTLKHRQTRTLYFQAGICPSFVTVEVGDWGSLSVGLELH